MNAAGLRTSLRITGLYCKTAGVGQPKMQYIMMAYNLT
jgi:hypothetical protein